MAVEKVIIEPLIRKNNGLFIIDVDEVKLPDDFEAKERSVVYIPPQQIGGNHRHPRKEIFIGLGDLELIWKDKNGDVHIEEMGGKELRMFVINSMVPHTVKNTSDSKFGVLIEFASEKQHQIEVVNLV